MKLLDDYVYFLQKWNVVQSDFKQKKAKCVKEHLQKNTNNHFEKNSGKHLRTCLWYTKFPISQTPVSNKITCYNPMKGKMLIPSKISRATWLLI